MYNYDNLVTSVLHSRYTTDANVAKDLAVELRLAKKCKLLDFEAEIKEQLDQFVRHWLTGNTKGVDIGFGTYVRLVELIDLLKAKKETFNLQCQSGHLEHFHKHEANHLFPRDFYVIRHQEMRAVVDELLSASDRNDLVLGQNLINILVYNYRDTEKEGSPYFYIASDLYDVLRDRLNLLAVYGKAEKIKTTEVNSATQKLLYKGRKYRHAHWLNYVVTIDTFARKEFEDFVVFTDETGDTWIRERDYFIKTYAEV